MNGSTLRANEGSLASSRTFRGAAVHGAALLALLLAGAGDASAQARPTPPPPLAARPIQFPPFEAVQLENGLRVVFLDYGSQPVVSLRLYAPGGTSTDRRERAGVASMAGTVLTRGTERMGAEEIAATIEGVGGSLSASAGRDFFSVSAVTLSEHVALGMELLADVVLRATFPEAEVELARRQTLSSLQSQRGQPQVLAGERFQDVLYGAAHPYGIRSTAESVRAIERQDLVRFRDEVLRPGGALLMVAGRVDRAQVEALVREAFGAWEGSAPPAPTAPPLSGSDRTRIHLVHRPGTTQSVVLVGHPGIRADNPDGFPLLVLNRILGGGSDARLFRILREEKGWTYGAYSDLGRARLQGSFVASAEVRTEVTDSTVIEVVRQIRRLQEEPVPQDELDAARNYLAGSFPLALQSADQVGGQVASTLLLDLPIEDLQGYPDRIRAVTAAEVERVARSYLFPDRASIVVVGEGTEILAPLEALNLGPIDIVDIEGNPLSREELLRDVEPTRFDGSALEAGVRRYEIFFQDAPVGSAEYRLERDGEVWISTAEIRSPAGLQELTLRFGVQDLAPIALRQRQGQGPMAMSVELDVVEGRLVGRADLPAPLGGPRDYDEPLGEGTLLPGMDDFALASAPLAPGARLSLSTLDLIQGGRHLLDARVTGEEEVTVAGGTFDTWRVEVSGGEVAMTLFLRKGAPHIVVRQEYAGQPLRVDLSGEADLP
jgi:zinc protease